MKLGNESRYMIQEHLIQTSTFEYSLTDSSSDDASIPEERIENTTPDREYNYPRDHLCNSREKIKMPSQRDNSERRHQNNAGERRPQNLPPPVIHHINNKINYRSIDLISYLLMPHIIF